MTNMRIYWDQILVDTSGGAFATRIDAARSRAAPTCAGAASRPRSTPGRPRAVRLRLRARVARRRRGRCMPGRYTREGRRAAAAAGGRRHVRRSRAPATRSRCRSTRAALPPLPAGLDADVPALRGRLQQGDEPPLREPGHGRAAAVPRDERLSVRAPASTTRARRAHREYQRALQHAASVASTRCRRSTPARAAGSSRGALVIEPMTPHPLRRRRLPDRPAESARSRGRCARTPTACSR